MKVGHADNLFLSLENAYKIIFFLEGNANNKLTPTSSLIQNYGLLYGNCTSKEG
jgi:hypothetical protein